MRSCPSTVHPWLSKSSITVRGGKLLQFGGNKIFVEKTFTDCSLMSLPKDAMPPILWRKLLRLTTNPWNLWKLFSLKSFLLYGIWTLQKKIFVDISLCIKWKVHCIQIVFPSSESEHPSAQRGSDKWECTVTTGTMNVKCLLATLLWPLTSTGRCPLTMFVLCQEHILVNCALLLLSMFLVTCCCYMNVC